MIDILIDSTAGNLGTGTVAISPYAPKIYDDGKDASECNGNYNQYRGQQQALKQYQCRYELEKCQGYGLTQSGIESTFLNDIIALEKKVKVNIQGLEALMNVTILAKDAALNAANAALKITNQAAIKKTPVAPGLFYPPDIALFGAERYGVYDLNDSPRDLSNRMYKTTTYFPGIDFCGLLSLMKTEIDAMCARRIAAKNLMQCSVGNDTIDNVVGTKPFGTGMNVFAPGPEDGPSDGTSSSGSYFNSKFTTPMANKGLVSGTGNIPPTSTGSVNNNSPTPTVYGNVPPPPAGTGTVPPTPAGTGMAMG